MMHAIHIAASGMRAQQARMTAISQNIANAHTLEGPDGQPYRRQVAHFESLPNGGVRARLGEDPEPYRQMFDPDHPRADKAGLVTVPDIDIPQELADMKIASQAYRANARVMNTAEECFDTLLRIFDKPRWQCDRHCFGC